MAEKEYLKNISISKLIPYEKNPRRNDIAVESLVKEITAVGNNDPIEVDENFVILCGHTRLKALKKMGINRTDIIQITGMDEEQKKRYRVTNNKTGELAEWDYEILEEDFQAEELEEMGFLREDEGLTDSFNLSSGDKAPFQQMTFHLADEQAEYIKNVLTEIKKTDEYKYIETFGNENGNGNALYLLATKWV